MQHPLANEQELIRLAHDGDHTALGQLYASHVDAIYQYMIGHTGDIMLAEDLTAEVFANMITSVHRYRDCGAPFRAWLFSIARARLADHWRKTSRQDRHDGGSVEAVAAQETPGRAHDQFEYEALEQALDYLTPAEREIVLLRFAGEFSNEEIAQIIKSNVNAVKSKMHRALKKLREVLTQQMKFQEELKL